MPSSSAARTHCGRDVVLDLRAVGEPVAVGDLGDLEAGVAEVAEFHALDPTGRYFTEVMTVSSLGAVLPWAFCG